MAEMNNMGTGTSVPSTVVNVKSSVTLSAVTPTGKTNVLFIGLGDIIYVADMLDGNGTLHRAIVTGFSDDIGGSVPVGGDVKISYSFLSDTHGKKGDSVKASDFGTKFFIAIGVNELVGCGESNSKIDTFE